MVTLFCAIVGVAGSAFSVRVDEGDLVDDVKDAIKVKNSATITCDAKDLQLFLAKMGDTWLKSKDAAVISMRSGGVPEEVKTLLNEEMDSADEIGDLFGDAPMKRTIHVLVVVPEGDHGSANETSATNNMIKEIYESTVLTKRKRYVHSKVGSTLGKELLNDLNIKVDLMRTDSLAVGTGAAVDAFNWESVIGEDGQSVVLTEEQQRERYRAYVERNIGAVLNEKQLCVIGVEKGQDILSVQVRGRDIELSGRTDLLILSDIVEHNPFDVQYLPEVKLLIEVKRAVKPSSDFQALSELIALDLLVDDPVMALLTDLNGEWLFFWVSEKENDSARICKARISTPGEAFEVIKTLLTQSPTAVAEIMLPCFREPVKRQKLSKVLPPIGEGGDCGGIRESIERYYDIASILGPDLDMARSVARQVTRSIPTLSYFS